MEISLNYGSRRLLISDNWVYLLFFIVSFIIALRKNRKKSISLKNKDLKDPTSRIFRGGDTTSTLQKFCDQCLSKKEYFEITDTRLKKIILKMLDIASNRPVIISTQVYLLALLKSQKTTVLTFNRGASKLIIENTPRFVGKSFLGLLMGPLAAAVSVSSVLMGIIPIGLLMLVYSYFHIDCNSYLTSLPTLNSGAQYIETRPNDDAAIIVSPDRNQGLLIYEFRDSDDLSTP